VTEPTVRRRLFHSARIMRLSPKVTTSRMFSNNRNWLGKENSKSEASGPVFAAVRTMNTNGTTKTTAMTVRARASPAKPSTSLRALIARARDG
jgi:hypothetical protein